MRDGAPRRDPAGTGAGERALRPFPGRCAEALADRQLRRNLRNATTTIRDKRARVVAEVPDWEELREAGRAIKADVLARLDEYLLQFEAAVDRGRRAGALGARRGRGERGSSSRSRARTASPRSSRSSR